jgi:hypothetical protein
MTRTPRPRIALALIVAACGGKAPAGDRAAVGNTGSAPATGELDPWAAFTTGATFTLERESDHLALTARVTAVDVRGEQREIRLAWDEAGTPSQSGPFSRVTVSPTRVRFDDLDVEFPLATEGRAPNGRSVVRHGDTVCYEDGPPDDAGDCPDVCFALVCVDRELGLVSGSGLWWPGYEPFELREK